MVVPTLSHGRVHFSARRSTRTHGRLSGHASSPAPPSSALTLDRRRPAPSSSPSGPCPCRIASRCPERLGRSVCPGRFPPTVYPYRPLELGSSLDARAVGPHCRAL